jgi:hypothetical protein
MSRDKNKGTVELTHVTKGRLKNVDLLKTYEEIVLELLSVYDKLIAIRQSNETLNDVVNRLIHAPAQSVASAVRVDKKTFPILEEEPVV